MEAHIGIPTPRASIWITRLWSSRSKSREILNPGRSRPFFGGLPCAFFEFSVFGGEGDMLTRGMDGLMMLVYVI